LQERNDLSTDTLLIDLAKKDDFKKMKEFKNYRDIEVLTITSSHIKGFTAYPPISSLEQSVPFGGNAVLLENLPEGISQLRRLKNLSLYGLGLKSLPKDFGKLKELEVLDLSFNNLNIIKELDKLDQLAKLRRLSIVGNIGDLATINQWQESKPDLAIFYQ